MFSRSSRRYCVSPTAAIARSGVSRTLSQAISGSAAMRSPSVRLGNATYIMTRPDTNHIANSRQVAMPILRWPIYNDRRNRRITARARSEFYIERQFRGPRHAEQPLRGRTACRINRVKQIVDPQRHRRLGIRLPLHAGIDDGVSRSRLTAAPCVQASTGKKMESAKEYSKDARRDARRQTEVIKWTRG